MSGPHPVVAAARRAVRQVLSDAEVPTGRRLLLAVSGGSDSMALAQAVLFVAARDGYPMASLTVDHGLRPDSRREAEQVAGWMQQHGVEQGLVRTVDVSGPGGPEAAARTARYRALADVARSLAGTDGAPAVVLLGHTADDQAETVLLGLARGSGARSIWGMPVVGALPGAEDVIALRPLLQLEREDLRDGLRSADIDWVDDPTNDLDSNWRAADGTVLRRSAIRHRVLPELSRALGPGVVGALGRTARQLRDDGAALDTWAQREIAGMGGQLAITYLRTLPVAVRTRVLRLEALAAGARAGELSTWHLAHLDDLVMGAGGGRGIDLPGGVRAVQRDGRICFDGVGLEGVDPVDRPSAGRVKGR
ncbi:MAG: tRNA lysidine(34) synthetase TilS [Actinomycetaceae bacterium]|nr:tRNA lysidine(34) synthetase TilS [Actinomycetaceae bacterium]